MRALERVSVITRIGSGKVVVHFLAVLINHAGRVNTLQQQRIVPCAPLKIEGQAEALEVIVQDGGIVSVAVVREEIAAPGEGDEIIVDAAQAHAVLQQERLADMVYRFGFGGDGERSFRQDVPVALVDGLPGICVELNERQLDDMLFLHIQTCGLCIKTNEGHMGYGLRVMGYGLRVTPRRGLSL